MGKIRAARPEEAAAITAIIIRAKAHWGYSAEWMERWRDDLTLTASEIETDFVDVYTEDEQIIGMSHLKLEGERGWLASLFVDPSAMGRGCGKCLLMHAIKRARDAGCRVLAFESDPHAVSFYERMGAVTISERESQIPGRMLPTMEIALITPDA